MVHENQRLCYFYYAQKIDALAVVNPSISAIPYSAGRAAVPVTQEVKVDASEAKQISLGCQVGFEPINSGLCHD